MVTIHNSMNHELADSRFEIPAKLYGRDHQIEQLQSAFRSICKGNGLLLLEPGTSGAGKTSLIQNLGITVQNMSGWFVQGKFEQYNKSIPYFAFKKVLHEIWTAMQALEESLLNKVKTNIQKGVGEFGYILTDLLPEFKDFLDFQTKTDEINFQEARHRFIKVIKNFFISVCRPEHPVVIFIDDWQWADTASMELLKNLRIGSELRYVLFIVAYRDEEIDESHPFYAALSVLKREDIPRQIIEVPNLTKCEVTEMISDTLQPNVENQEALAALTYSHTTGNPFYTRAFLEFLHENGSIRYEPGEARWRWRVDERELPPDIVELFLKRLRGFPPETQTVLSLAACLGNRFKEETLSIVAKRSLDECRKILDPVLEKKLLIIPDKTGDISSHTDHPEPRWILFFHDRVQQATFQLLEPEKLTRIRLGIGRLLLSTLSEENLDERLLDVLEQLNLCVDFISDPSERLRLVELNMAAALKAKSATAYGAMLQYYRAAKKFSNDIQGGPEWFWENRYEEALRLSRGLAESEFIEGNKSEAESIIQASLQHTQSTIEKAETLSILIVHFTLMARYSEAIQAGRQALGQLGIELPEEHFEKNRDAEIENIYAQLKDKTVASLVETPVMTDPKIITVTKLLITMGPPCYRTHQKLWSVIVPKVIDLTLKYGLIPQIGYSHTAFGGLLCWVHNDYDTAREFSKLAPLVMSSKFSRAYSDQSVFYLMMGSSTRHWFEHLEYASRDYQTAYEIGLQSSNLQYAAYAFGHNMYCSFYRGVFLSVLIQETSQSHAFSISRGNQWAIDLLEGALLLFNQLTTADSESIKLSDEAYIAQVNAHKNIQVMCIYRIMKTFVLLLLGEYRAALEESDKAEEFLYTVGTQGLLPWPEHVFTRFLILSALYGSSTEGQKATRLAEMDKIKKQIEIWSQQCPENYTHKFLLAAAEMKRIDDKEAEAIFLYDQAIKAAKNGKFLQWEGIANERASHLWKSLGNDRLSSIYWQQAYLCYTRWGVAFKVKSMESDYRKELKDWFSFKTGMHSKTEAGLTEFIERQMDLLHSIARDKIEARKKEDLSKQTSELANASEQLRIEISERKQVENALRLSEAELKKEIIERKEIEEKLQSALLEKETLLQEIHHRVKNNMNVVSSLLHLHAYSTENQEVKKALQESQGRVYAMSFVHEALYQSKNLSKIDVSDYLIKLSQSLIQTYSVSPDKVQLKIEGDEAKINIEKASPLGLTLNELVSNSLKYAFPDDRKGEIVITTRIQDDELELVVADDGIGVPEGFKWEDSSSLGLKLVRNLVENQLNGEIVLNNRNGTTFTIKIPLKI